MDIKEIFKRYALFAVAIVLYFFILNHTLRFAGGYLCMTGQWFDILRVITIYPPPVILIWAISTNNIKKRNLLLASLIVLMPTLFLLMEHEECNFKMQAPDIPGTFEDPIVFVQNPDIQITHGKTFELDINFYNSNTTAEFTPVITCESIPSQDFSVSQNINVPEGEDKKFKVTLNEQATSMPKQNCEIIFQHPEGYQTRDNFSITIT